MSESNHEADLSYAGWRVTAAASVGILTGFASLFIYTFGIFLKPLTAGFGWSREAVSLGFAIAAMTVAACSPPLGWLLDRYGPRRILLPCITVFGLGFASLGLLTPHLWRFYATMLLLGIVGNGTAHLAYSRAVSSWFQHRRGFALALLMAGGALGSMVLPPLAQALIDNAGWRAAYAILGAMVLAAGLPVVAAWVREQPAPHRNRAMVSGVAVSAGLRSRSFWTLVVVLFLSSIGQNASITHLAALLTDRGVSPAEAAIAVAALGAASLAGRLVTGWLLDRFFAPRVSFCLLAISALGVFLLARANSLAVGATAAILIGAGMGGEADVTPYLLTRYFGLRSFSTLYGFTWTAYAIAGAIGPVLMGRAFDTTASYQALILKLAALMLTSAALMLTMPAYASQFASPPAEPLPDSPSTRGAPVGS